MGSSTSRRGAGATAALLAALLLAEGCASEVLEKQAQQIRAQEAEIARQREEIQALMAAQQAQEQKRRDCSRAFRDYFEKAESAANPETAVTLYREGLVLCPDDEVARYELGKALAKAGRLDEAEREFRAALEINPGFAEAKRQLDELRRPR